MNARTMESPTALGAQVPYWVAVLTPEERTFGSRRTDSRIDTIGSSVVTDTRTQWVGLDNPTATTLLAVLSATIGAWQSDRCRSCASGALIDVVSCTGSLFPVRLPTSGDVDALTEEVRRRVAAAPNGGSDFVSVRSTLDSPALARKSGAQIAFHHGRVRAVEDDGEPLEHSLTVTCETIVVDGVTLVDAQFRWNSRAFTRADVDDFERFWEKTISAFVRRPL